MVTGVIVAARITADGVTLVEEERSVNDGRSAAVDVYPTITVAGHGNVFQFGSPGARASVTVTITDDHRRQILELAQAVEEAVPVLGPSVADVPAELRTAAQDGQTDPGVIRAVLEKTKMVLIEAHSKVIVGLILAGYTDLFGHFGVVLPH